MGAENDPLIFGRHVVNELRHYDRLFETILFYLRHIFLQTFIRQSNHFLTKISKIPSIAAQITKVQNLFFQVN
jgi:hypothetical protein